MIPTKYAEGLAQTRVGSVVVAANSVSFYERYLFHSLEDDLLVFLTPLATTDLPLTPLLCVSPSCTSCLAVCHCICSHQLLDDISLLSTGLDVDL